MVSREDLRIAVYNELETAVDGLVDADNVSQQYPETEEQLPAVVHDDAYRQIPMNIHTGVKNVSTDNSGENIYHYSMLKEAQFSLTVAARTETEKEDVYHALQEYFEAYTFPIKSASDIHEDVNRVTLSDTNSNDDDNSEPVTRQDTLSLNIEYERIYDLDVTPAEAVERGIIVNDDTGGSTEL